MGILRSITHRIGDRNGEPRYDAQQAPEERHVRSVSVVRPADSSWTDQLPDMSSLPGWLQVRGGRFARGSLWSSLPLAGPMHHQDELRRISAAAVMDDRGYRNFLVALTADPGNQYDPNAVVVHAGTIRLGHLRREDAAKYHPEVATVEAEAGAMVCGAIVVGGDDGKSFGCRIGYVRPTRAERKAGITI